MTYDSPFRRRVVGDRVLWNGSRRQTRDAGGNPDLADLPVRVAALERALAFLAGAPDDGCDCTDAYGMTAAKPTNMTAAKTFSPSKGERKATDGVSLGTTIKPLSSDEETAETLRSINAKNAETRGGTTTAGSQSTPAPGTPSQANSGGYLPNATGSISQSDISRSSVTAKTLDPGKTSSWGTDRASIRQGNRYRNETARVNDTINAINARHRAFWGRA
jgi:hypothetical protein